MGIGLPVGEEFVGDAVGEVGVWVDDFVVCYYGGGAKEGEKEGEGVQGGLLQMR